MPAVAGLPNSDPVARAHGERVDAHLRAAIAAAGGWIPFARFMDLALYAPGLGYYSAGACKLGAAGDFTTAPEMTPLFGNALAVQVAAILEATDAREIVELGAGTGRLAADLLNALARRDALPSRYAILEVSADLRERQRATLEREAAGHLSRVEWLAALPATIDGAVVANEVLDAIPVHVIARRAGSYVERGVVEDKARGVLAFADRPAPAMLAKLAAARFPPAIDYVSELNPAAEALVEELGRRMVGGAALFIDYGFPRSEYFHEQRSEGTLLCHHRQRVHGEPLHEPGLSDITAHVDFTAMAEAAERAGLVVAGFAAQAPFLLGCGILDLLAATGAADTSAYMRAAATVQRLLSPAEMGELFKVLAVTRSERIDWPGFALANHRHRL
jgi:SAM-dependent MidA family methyltransferase